MGHSRTTVPCMAPRMGLPLIPADLPHFGGTGLPQPLHRSAAVLENLYYVYQLREKPKQQ